jgi:quinol monooxygenase YgiN
MILVRFHWTSPVPDAARWEQAFSADGGRSWETNWIMEFTRSDGAATDVTGNSGDGERCCPVVELRQYALHPGQRETLIELFDREFVESQESTGMTVVAQFRDLDRPDVFTWIRGFADMPSRASALEAFYSGPVWRRYRDLANATMISSDNVRLMRGVHPQSGFTIRNRPGPGTTTLPPGLVVATIYTLRRPAVEGFTAFFEQVIVPILAAHGVQPLAVFETNPSANTYPRLPVREGEHAFAWFAGFSDLSAYDRYTRALGGDRHWTEAAPELERRMAAAVEIWRLQPTSRSRPIRG